MMNATKATTTATAATVRTTSTTASANAERNKVDANTIVATSKTDCSFVHSKLNLSNDNKNVIVISVTVSVATLIHSTVYQRCNVEFFIQLHF